MWENRDIVKNIEFCKTWKMILIKKQVQIFEKRVDKLNILSTNNFTFCILHVDFDKGITNSHEMYTSTREHKFKWHFFDLEIWKYFLPQRHNPIFKKLSKNLNNKCYNNASKTCMSMRSIKAVEICLESNRLQRILKCIVRRFEIWIWVVRKARLELNVVEGPYGPDRLLKN